ncbi:peptidylprolyl isomerase fpr4 [Mycoblastus sanguinarius]|nr:peptidylprolyl isomerase fpr4 [Mycoblastus sanguinarius]
MSSMLPVAVYGLKVPAGDVMIPAIVDFPATFHITMAAIDPSDAPEHTGTASGDGPARATLKIVYDPMGPSENDDSEDSDDEENYLKALLEGRESDDEEDEDDDESSSDDEEKNGGPSDPTKTKKARKEAAVQQMMEALAKSQDEDEDEMDVDNSPAVNGVLSKSKSNKGKGKALAEDSEDDESLGEDDSEDSMGSMDELVLCTLDPQKNYQQPLDITIPEDQRAYFKVSGTHAIYLTGNYVIPADNSHNHQHELYDGEDEEDEYDMSPDENELELEAGDEESDELDNLEDPRITELASEDEAEAPKLVKKEVIVQEEPAKKGKNKRAREGSDSEVEPVANLDDIVAKSLKPEEPTTNGEAKLSKKQLKKMKKQKSNAGEAIEAALENKETKKDDAVDKDSSSLKGDKKVQFAKNLEQGPVSSSDTKTDSKDKAETEAKKGDGKPKASLGMKTVQGVTIDDKKLGDGPAAKKGDKVGLRYIGKLQDGKQFDVNKKGTPFRFTIGDGSVIKGWDIGVAGMSVGSERRIIIPAELAYGKKAMPGIPANSKLTFDMKLLEIR